jgi:hypothetical protein
MRLPLSSRASKAGPPIASNDVHWVCAAPWPRKSEAEICHDFPGTKSTIRGSLCIFQVGLSNVVCKAAGRAARQTSQPCFGPTFCRSGVRFQLSGIGWIKTKLQNPTLSPRPPARQHPHLADDCKPVSTCRGRTVQTARAPIGSPDLSDSAMGGGKSASASAAQRRLRRDFPDLRCARGT